MSKGLLHLYLGDGKGKTTAAIGMAVRAVGGGCPVIFAQFLKDSPTGELASFEALGILVVRSRRRLGFTFLMDDEAKALCASEQRAILTTVAETLMVKLSGKRGVEGGVGVGSVEDGNVDGNVHADAGQTERPGDFGPQILVVLDEALDALDRGLLDEGELRTFIEKVPIGAEVVLTGRKAPGWLVDRADYHTEFKKLKHPWDQGTSARKSIEF
jgi:cob(I)alamin adenosyltransferase